MELKIAFGKALKEIRSSRRVTQEDFSQVSSRTYLSTLERGLKSPTIDKVEGLASVLGVHPLTLIAKSYLLLEDKIVLEDLFTRIKEDLSDLQGS